MPDTVVGSDNERPILYEADPNPMLVSPPFNERVLGSDSQQALGQSSLLKLDMIPSDHCDQATMYIVSLMMQLTLAPA